MILLFEVRRIGVKLELIDQTLVRSVSRSWLGRCLRLEKVPIAVGVTLDLQGEYLWLLLGEAWSLV